MDYNDDDHNDDNYNDSVTSDASDALRNVIDGYCDGLQEEMEELCNGTIASKMLSDK